MARQFDAVASEAVASTTPRRASGRADGLAVGSTAGAERQNPVDFLGPSVDGAGVLIRALEPTAGWAVMQQRRGGVDGRLLCAGPGRLAQALGVTGAHDGSPIDRPPFALLPPPQNQPWPEVLVGVRVGISKAQTVPWRFGLRGSRFLSRRFA